MLYEIRNYHFDPERFDAYKRWAAEEALPFLKRELDLVGFWVNNEEPADVIGEPMDAMGSANITWIIRWSDKATRDATMERVFGGDEEWAGIFARVPGGFASYKRMESKFTEALL